MFDYRNYRNHFLKQKHYVQLLADLKVMLDASRTEVKDLSQGRDLLHCIGCGVKEEYDVDEEHMSSSGKIKSVPPGSFILIEAKQKSIYVSGKPRKLNIYSYICPECGLYQNSLVRCA